MRWRSLLQTADHFLPRCFRWLLLAAVILYGFTPQIPNVDMGWHLTQGEWIITNRQFLREDLFNFPNLHNPFVSEYTLYQPLYWLMNQLGEVFVAAVTSFLIVFLFLLPFALARKIGFSAALIGLSLMLAYIMGLLRHNFRPELFTSLGVVFFGVFLLANKDQKDWRRFWPLALAMFVWVNCHSGFILGLGLIGFFGAEMAARSFLTTKKLPAGDLVHWLKVGLFVFAACFVNPYGWKRIALPFYHQGSQVIRAYVTEMQPMDFNLSDFFVAMMVLQLCVIFISFLLYRGGISWGLLAFLFVIYYGSFISQRHVGLFAVLAPVVVVSCGVFGRPVFWLGNWPGHLLSIGLHVALVISAFLFAFVQLESSGHLGLVSRWHVFAGDGDEVNTCADWMRRNRVGGKIFNRSEIGSWIQSSKLGLSFSDTGFGKFSESFIHEIGLSCERHNYLPWLLKKYQPDCVVCSAQAYAWPDVLNRLGWRCVYYTPNRSIWLPPGARPDLPTVTLPQIKEAYLNFLSVRGIPTRGNILYWPLLKLHSIGLSRLATNVLLSLPQERKFDKLFWDCLDMMAFRFKPLPPDCLEDLHQLTSQPQYDEWNLLFNTRYLVAKGNLTQAVAIMEKVPQSGQNDPLFTMLAQCYITLGDWEKARALLLKDNLFVARNGDRYAMLAAAHARFGDYSAAAAQWKKALFFSPDDATVRRDVAAFLAAHPDTELTRILQEIERGQ